MYGGHFPPLGHTEMVEVPPIRFFDREERRIGLYVYGESPYDDEYGALAEMYHEFDPRFRTLGIPPASEGRLREWLDVILEGYCVLAWHEGRVVGQAVLVEDRSADPAAYELAIFLHQDYHGAGIGTRLTEALLSYGREHGVERVWLLVEHRNRPAVNLYRDVGFLVTETLGPDVEMALSMAV